MTKEELLQKIKESIVSGSEQDALNAVDQYKESILNTDEITRINIIGNTGIEYSNYNVRHCGMQWQDGRRTLKLFIVTHQYDAAKIVN